MNIIDILKKEETKRNQDRYWNWEDITQHLINRVLSAVWSSKVKIQNGIPNSQDHDFDQDF